MNDPKGYETEKRHLSFISGQTRLEIVATKVGDKEWSLSVINSRGIFSTWWEFFDSPDTAISTAIQAIHEEGIQEFTDIEGFEYLDERLEDEFR